MPLGEVTNVPSVRGTSIPGVETQTPGGDSGRPMRLQGIARLDSRNALKP